MLYDRLVLTQCFSRNFSELQVRVDGVEIDKETTHGRLRTGRDPRRYLGWPESALFAVANQFLASFKFGAEDDAKEEVCRTAVAKICVKVHTSINETGERFYNELRRKTYTTPKSYLDLIGMYSSKLGELQGQVDVKIEQMEVGCAKLAETNAARDRCLVFQDEGGLRRPHAIDATRFLE